MQCSKEKPRTILADGFGACVEVLRKGINEMNTITPTGAPQAVPSALGADQKLSRVEARLIENFRTTTDGHQKNLALVMASMAKNYPRRTAPSLRLVVGGIL